jgi:hypothetical protein
MKMRIEVYQRNGGNPHVVLLGQATGNSDRVDPDIFTRYVEVWRAFNGAHGPEAAAESEAPSQSPA